MDRFKPLQKKLSYLGKKQLAKVKQAYKVAKEAHTGQKRSSGEEYITHPIAVAAILADMHMDSESIMAALLHDVIEDTSIDKDTVSKTFGNSVAEIVDGVTKLTKIQFSSTAEAQAESFRKMILAMSQDIRVILVKLADRLHNMRTIISLPLHKRKRIAKETLEIYAPIANRLGIRDIYEELQNLGFIALYPSRYQTLQNAVKKVRGNRKEIMSTIKRDLKKALSKHKVSKCRLIGREKTPYSIYKKMVNKHLSFSEIMDVYAFRIIVGSIDTCYRTLGFVHSAYKPMPGKFKDYIAIPKINGYQSLHTTLVGPHAVPVEIQIRTTKMDQLANKGIASHWLYKQKEKTDEAHLLAQQWINDLLELQKNTGNSLEFVENVKIDLFPREIYVFTPKGKIFKLPKKSTAVDLAYAIHTDIGNSCVAAKINRQFAPLSTPLTNGQTVSIITAPNARPNPAWLNFVETSKAKSGIRTFLKKQKRSESISLGKDLLDKALQGISLQLNKIPKKVFNKILAETKTPTLNNLYEEIGLGNRVAAFVATQIASSSKHKDAKNTKAEIKEKPLLITGTEGMAVELAECCHPIPGDNIIGCITPGHGLTIHTSICDHIEQVKQKPENCLMVRWADNVKGDFTAIINVEMSSEKGSFAQLTRTIFDNDASLEDITINKRTGKHYSATLKLFVNSVKHLNKVLLHINNLKVVTSAKRATELKTKS